MNEPLKIDVPCRCATPMSSNMTPPRLVPVSCSRANRTQTAHCGASAQRDQCACIASCISWSDQVPGGVGITESPPVFVTWIPSRAYALSRVSVEVGAVGAWTGWVAGLCDVTAVASLTVSYSKATSRKAACLECRT